MQSGRSNGGPRFAPVILAGGSGTRFWPRSRKSRAKQVLALDGERTMIQQTLDRLLPLASPQDIWVITNALLDDLIADQLPEVSRQKILSEPAARNTAPACALAAFLLEPTEPDTVIGIFPSDHVVKGQARFAEVIRAGVALAGVGDTIVVLGVPPTRAETGYGYIELGEAQTANLARADEPSSNSTRASSTSPIAVRSVKRFTEKPDSTHAEQFVASGNYAWNSGIFLWSARTLANAVREHCPAMARLLEQIAAAHRQGTQSFNRAFSQLYPECQNISIDYAVLEPRSAKGEHTSHIVCLPADFAWNDIGCWAALNEHRAAGADQQPDSLNVCDEVNGAPVVIDASGNYVYAPGKAVVLLGVTGLIVVETPDALLITTRERSQDVGKAVAELKARGRDDLT